MLTYLVAAGARGLTVKRTAKALSCAPAKVLETLEQFVVDEIASRKRRGSVGPDRERCDVYTYIGGPFDLTLVAWQYINDHGGWCARIIDDALLFVTWRDESWLVEVVPPGPVPPPRVRRCEMDVMQVVVHPDGNVDASALGFATDALWDAHRAAGA